MATVGGTPPTSLWIRFLARDYNALPDVGGLRAQEARLMSQMTACDMAHRVTRKLMSLRPEVINTMSRVERAMACSLRDDGVLDAVKEFDV
jgi:hypothetical protein